MRRSLIPLLVFAALGCRANDPVDLDADGFDATADCNDNDETIHPTAAEVCDGIDQDCDGEVDDEAQDASTWYLDGDGDGYGSASVSVTACDAPTGYVSDSSDCNDGDSAFHPGAEESDCTDSADYNCDGSSGFVDADGDGFPACQDCDDAAAAVNADSVETCDEIDNDCDGSIDEAGAIGESTWYADGDDDGYGNALDAVTACEAPEGRVGNGQDCNDSSAAAFPGGVETCDNLDNDCDGEIDDNADDASTWYADGDDDGFGRASTAVIACDAPLGFVDNRDDCDDADDAVRPDASEICDDSDNDCDGTTDEGFDSDADGYVSCVDDCDDNSATTHPGAAETCDGADNDCDGDIDEAGATGAPTWYIDYDGDGAGDTAFTQTGCTAPAGYVDNADDCNDLDPAYSPTATPGCDGEDYDCDGAVDNDADGDGYPDQACGGIDCDDSDASVFPDTNGGCPVGTDCADILARDPSAPSGVYTVDPDGFQTGVDSFDVYCDMETDAGGWTMCISSTRGDSDTMTLSEYPAEFGDGYVLSSNPLVPVDNDRSLDCSVLEFTQIRWDVVCLDGSAYNLSGYHDANNTSFGDYSYSSDWTSFIDYGDTYGTCGNGTYSTCSGSWSPFCGCWNMSTATSGGPRCYSCCGGTGSQDARAIYMFVR